MARLMSLHINPEYQKLLPKVVGTEYKLLRRSIESLGQLYPIIINNKGAILDGHNRYEICLELGITPKTQTQFFKSKLEEKRFVIVTNLRRRHLNKYQRAELGIPLLNIETELAKRRMSEAGKIGVEIREGRVGSNEPTLANGRARDIVAKQVMLSPTTFQRALVVAEKGSDKLKETVRKGEKSITTAYHVVMKQQKHHDAPPLPKQKFDVVYADPPWKYNVKLRGTAEDYYDTMSIKEIKDVKPPTSENAVLFLWATNPMLQDALELMRHWGFEYKTNIVWIKNKITTGFYVRGQHELLLIGIKGDAHPPQQSNRKSSVIMAPISKHSEKPKEVYKIIEEMYPDLSKIEMFARDKREGWHSWGNEI